MSLADWLNRNAFPNPNTATSGGISQPPLAQTNPHLNLVRYQGVNLANNARKASQAPTREEFSTWRDHPITEFVMAALVRNAEECREQWMRASWDNGQADPSELIALRERSDALLGFTADYEAFCETLGLEPAPMEQNDAA